jgi:hypothetical protein
VTMPAWLPAPLLLLLLVAAGHSIARWIPGTVSQRVVTALVAGALLLHLLLTTLDAIGVRWNAGIVVGALVIVAAIGWRPTVALPSARPGWGDLLALGAVIVFAALAWTLWITFPDFIYHWGLKAHRYLLTGHVDYGFLAQPGNWAIHPDYPSLFPELLATTASLGGGWDERALLLWSPLMMLFVLAAARELLAVERVAAFRRHAVVALVAFAVAAFAIANLMAGAADWLLALALVAALPALLAAPSTARDLQLGLCAALAAASKQEGLVMAAMLVVAQLVRRWRARAPIGWLGGGGLVVLPASVVACHAIRVAQHHLFQHYDKAAPSPARLGAVLHAMGNELVSPVWSGLALLLLVLPLLVLAPRLRPFVAVAGLHLLAYVVVCAGQPSDEQASFLVLTTFTRIVLQLLPATLAGAAVAWLGGQRDEPA